MTDDEISKYPKISVNNQPAPWLLGIRGEFDATDQSESIENGTIEGDA